MGSSIHVAQELLNQAHPPEAAATIFKEKVLHRPLRLRPTSPDLSSQDARAKRRTQRLRKKQKSQRRQKPRPLSAKEKRVTGIYDIPDEQKRYAIYEPLHRMWLGYMWEILGIKKNQQALVTAHSAGSKLACADYHGAEVTVIRSQCVSMVGLSGIVVRDTKFTFQVITRRNELKSTYTCPYFKLEGSPWLTRSSHTKETHGLSFRDSAAHGEWRGKDAKNGIFRSRCSVSPSEPCV